MSRKTVIEELQKYIQNYYTSAQVKYAGECSIGGGRLQYDPTKLEDINNGVYFFLHENGVKYGIVRQNTRSIQGGLNLVRADVAHHGFRILYEKIKSDKIDKLYLYIVTCNRRVTLNKIKNLVENFFKEIETDTKKDNHTKYEEFINLLKYKKQIILQGAPGTGKTFTAKKIAEAMKCEYEIVQFHPSYTYEDFVRGIVSKTDENGNISYEVEDKILINAIKKAEENKNKNKPYILIIDEINRANLPSVLGELLYALEYRDEAVICPYKKDKEDEGKIIIPKNLYIIGTMNTADRSIGSIDYAVRRRFAFYTVKADEKFIKDDYSKNVFKYIKNEIIEKHLSEEYQLDDIMIGHSYFIFNDEEVYSDTDLVRKYMNLSLQYNIIPLLKEYYKDGILIDSDEFDVSVIDTIDELNDYIDSEE